MVNALQWLALGYSVRPHLSVVLWKGMAGMAGSVRTDHSEHSQRSAIRIISSTLESLKQFVGHYI